MARIPASKQTRKRLTELFDGVGATEGDGGELVKLAARLIVEEALEEEVEDVVGRGYYAHGDGSGGHRNGYRRGKLDTAEGRIEYGCQWRTKSPHLWQSKIPQGADQAVA